MTRGACPVCGEVEKYDPRTGWCSAPEDREARAVASHCGKARSTVLQLRAEVALLKSELEALRSTHADFVHEHSEIRTLCPHCGRDNTGYEDRPCSDDCPGVVGDPPPGRD